ncbi:MAG: sirohydrochlorin cobaltochelatase [Desulfobacula sp.]|uniref:sirohydrochlorin cobaltochelatase n=1 Tax=Desulfobacula sp. TaxID=2593537 RepID=UPI0025B999C4|nr:sirohydrochlorin cobaltochelatase [Desulfobacula sp.]MCD4721359.1 sirohydrochlorin cobaltochelatase [Desulfobacula sp.]
MHQHEYIGRKMRLPKLKEKPAIVIAAFGSTSRAKAALDIFKANLAQGFPDHETFWAYTSEIIRKKMGLPSLQETLAKVEAMGFRKVVVQPLHIFPGTEYHQMAETCEYFPGLRVLLSETLLHRWGFIKETLGVVEAEFLSPAEGLNLLALHGTPLSADPVNIVYLGMERLVADRYPNVLAVSIEGVPDPEAVLAHIKRQDMVSQYKKVKIIPMMYIAGLHAEEDLMGDEDSWRTALEGMGFIVECPMVKYDGKDYYKGLAYYPELINFFMERLKRSLSLTNYY